MVEITIEPQNVEAVARVLALMPEKFRQVTKKAIKKGLQVGKKTTRENAKKRYTLPAGIVAKSLSLRVSGLSGELKSVGSRNALEKAVISRVKGGIYAQVVRGQGGLIARSFSKKYAGGLWQRSGASRLPIKRLKTVSAPGMAGHPQVANPTVNKIAEIVNRELLSVSL